jgi:hypothetical protein
MVLTKSGRPIPWDQQFFPCPPRKEDPINLTGTTIVAKMYGCGRSQPEKVVLGTVVITDAVNGVITYKWNASDTDTAGFYLMSFEITDPTTSTKLIWPYLRENFTIEVTA